MAYYWEITDLLEGKKVDLSKIEKRKDTYSFIVNGHDFYEYNLKTANKIKKDIESTLDTSGEIKGQIACMGKVKGIVKVLHSPKEMNKIKKGDILVTSMTTPDYVPAMERAAAFVTDEGGLSCHAAIVAREMKKHYQLRGERIWLQDNKTLFPYGYRYSFVPNVHHHYCLIFKKTVVKE